MALRNPWVLPAVSVILLAVLGLAVYGGAAIKPEPPHEVPPAGANLLKVPGSYNTIQAAIDAAKPGDRSRWQRAPTRRTSWSASPSR